MTQTPQDIKLLLTDLLDELRYVYDTNDVRDSIRYSADLRDEVAQALGFADYDDFVAASK